MLTKVLLAYAILAHGSASLVAENPAHASQDVLTDNQLTTIDMHQPVLLQQLLSPELLAGVSKRAGTKNCLAIEGGGCCNIEPLSGNALTEIVGCLIGQSSESDDCHIAEECTVSFVECFSEAPPAAVVDIPHLLAESTLTIDAATPAKLELREEPTYHIMARQNEDVSEVVQDAMPASVKEAMLNDPNAAESLAQEFSGTSLPEWYMQMPANVQAYYATITTPPMMSGVALTDSSSSTNIQNPSTLVGGWVSSIKSYESQISSLSKEASSHSQRAKAHSEIADSQSRQATKEQSSALAATASQESILAASESRVASSESRLAASASRAVHGLQDEVNKKQGTAPSLHTSMALLSSSVGAVTCLVVALAL